MRGKINKSSFSKFSEIIFLHVVIFLLLLIHTHMEVYICIWGLLTKEEEKGLCVL